MIPTELREALTAGAELRIVGDPDGVTLFLCNRSGQRIDSRSIPSEQIETAVLDIVWQHAGHMAAKWLAERQRWAERTAERIERIGGVEGPYHNEG